MGPLISGLSLSHTISHLLVVASGENLHQIKRMGISLLLLSLIRANFVEVDISVFDAIA
jgi:hypothetical protein